MLDLIREYLQETARLGGDIVNCEENARLLDQIAYEIEHCVRPGALVYEPEVGFSMAVEVPSVGLISSHGKTAMGLGTYIREEHRRRGLSLEFREKLMDQLADSGFDRLLGGASLENDIAIRSMRKVARAEQVVFVVDLPRAVAAESGG